MVTLRKVDRRQSEIEDLEVRRSLPDTPGFDDPLQRTLLLNLCDGCRSHASCPAAPYHGKRDHNMHPQAPKAGQHTHPTPVGRKRDLLSGVLPVGETVPHRLGPEDVGVLFAAGWLGGTKG